MKKNRIWSKLNQQVHNLFLLLLEYQKLINKKKNNVFCLPSKSWAFFGSVSTWRAVKIKLVIRGQSFLKVVGSKVGNTFLIVKPWYEKKTTISFCFPQDTKIL